MPIIEPASVSYRHSLYGMPTARTHRLRAFTLVELLVVIAVISALMAISLPALNSARERGRRTVCLANLRSIGQAIALYAQDHDGRLIPGDSSTPWLVWTRPDEPYDASDNAFRPVNLGHLLQPEILPMPTNKGTVMFCPSSYRMYENAPMDSFQRTWGAEWTASVTYAFNETLDGSVCSGIDGDEEIMLAHRDAINFVRADGSADALHMPPMAFEERRGAEGIAEVVARYGVCFPTSMIFDWLERGDVDVVEARTFLLDQVAWYEENGPPSVRKGVLLADVGSKPLVADMIGVPRYG